MKLDSYSSKLPQLRTKRADLYATVARYKAECAEIRARLQHAPLAGNDQENRIRALIGETTAKATRLPDTERLDQLLRDLTDLNAAVSIIDAQVDVEMRAASVALCEAVAPEHSALARKFATKMIELHAAETAYLKFVDSVEDTGASTTSLSRMPRSWLGSPLDPSSGYHHFLKESVDAGHIAKAAVPESIR
jgi:predicted RNA-binding Zn ribbon-like protein